MSFDGSHDKGPRRRPVEEMTMLEDELTAHTSPPPNGHAPRPITTQAAANLLGFSRSYALRLLTDSATPVGRRGHFVLWSRADVEAVRALYPRRKTYRGRRKPINNPPVIATSKAIPQPEPDDSLSLLLRCYRSQLLTAEEAMAAIARVVGPERK
jgi:hypothetical protein